MTVTLPNDVSFLLSMIILAQLTIISAILSLLLCSSYLGMPFDCVRTCGRSFPARPGLNRHQNDCAIYQTSQLLKQEQRRQRAQLNSSKAHPGATRGNLSHRKLRMQDMEAHVSCRSIWAQLYYLNLCLT